jgi:2-oxoisovalerate dehydrogenase E1 component
LSRKLDDKELQLKHQSKIFFQISGAGHEAVQVAAGLALKPAYDWFFPYYRDRALCLQLGVTPLNMLLAAVGSSRDPSSAGRQMPSHWGDKALNIVSGSSPTGTQVLHAVGAGDASLIYSRVAEIQDRAQHCHADEVIFTSLGDGSTSEGEFWEAINWTCLRQLPVLFLVEDNAYAISVPVEFQTAGGDISRLVRSFPGLRVDSIDGTDFLVSWRALRNAVAYIRARNGPVLVHARCIRPYSHSQTDDERLYKTPAERESEAQRDPITRFAEFLRSHELATDEDLAGLLNGRSMPRCSRRCPLRSPTGRRRRFGSTRRMSIRRPRRSTRPNNPRASPTRWSASSIARSRTKWRSTPASSSSAKTWPTPAGGKP